MSVPSPFTASNVITATLDILNEYPEDAYAQSAKGHLSRLRQRMGYSAPEVVAENFWSSSANYEGYYDICKEFDQNDARSKAMFTLYSGVQRKFRENGQKFEETNVHSRR